jgi:hypothetical protein
MLLQLLLPVFLFCACDEHCVSESILLGLLFVVTVSLLMVSAEFCETNSVKQVEKEKEKS